MLLGRGVNHPGERFIPCSCSPTAATLPFLPLRRAGGGLLILIHEKPGILADVRPQLISLPRGGVAGAVPAPLCLLACTTRAVGCSAPGMWDSGWISLVRSHPFGSGSDVIQDSSFYYKIIRVCQAGLWQGGGGAGWPSVGQAA